LQFRQAEFIWKKKMGIPHLDTLELWKLAILRQSVCSRFSSSKGDIVSSQVGRVLYEKILTVL
jgi:adenylate kinase family enzyme